MDQRNNMPYEMEKEGCRIVFISQAVSKKSPNEIGARMLVKKKKIVYDDQIEKFFLTGTTEKHALQHA